MTTGDGEIVVEAYKQELSRSLTMRGTILITLSAVTPASSVFIIIPAVLLAVGGASFAAFLGAAVVGVLMAFCYGELASAFPIAGGEYSFVARVLGKGTGFALYLMNALSIVLIIGVIALGTGEYLAAAIGTADSKWVGVAVIVVATLVAVLNIRSNAWLTGTFLVIEILALIVLVVLGFTHTSRGIGTLFDAQTAGANGTMVAVSLGVIGAQMATAIFAYNGYGAAIYFAEETHDASAKIARAILWALGITVAAEIIPLTAVILGAPSMTALLHSDAPMQYFITELGSSGLNRVISAAIAIAIINAVVAITLQGGRTLYSSARDRAYPDVISRPLAYVHPTLKTPVTSTLLIGLIAAVTASVVSLNALIIATGATLLVLYALVAASALVGRRNGTTAHAKYKMPLYPLVPALVILILLYVAYQLWQANPWQIVIAVGTMVAGYAYYYAYLYPRRATRWTMPGAPPEQLIEADLEGETVAGLSQPDTV